MHTFVRGFEVTFIITVILLMLLFNNNFKTSYNDDRMLWYTTEANKGSIKAYKGSIKAHEGSTEALNGTTRGLEGSIKTLNYKTKAVVQISEDIKRWCLRKASPSKYCLPLTALASFPGSGNTWMRCLIEKLTGISTGAIYYDGMLKRNGLTGEGKNGCNCVAIKTHAYNGVDPTNRRQKGSKNTTYQKAILLLRNPYDSLVAEFNRRAVGHIGRIKDESYYGTKWNNYLRSMSKRWVQFVMSWARFNGPLLVVVYDNLKADLFVEMATIGDFLKDEHINITVECAVHFTDNTFLRPPSNRTNKNIYNREQVTFLNRQIDFVHRHFRYLAFDMSKWKL